MEIKNNPSNLTPDEKQELNKAKYYVFVYGVGLILVETTEGKHLSWNCSNSVAAKQYLENNSVRELL